MAGKTRYDWLSLKRQASGKYRKRATIRASGTWFQHPTVIPILYTVINFIGGFLEKSIGIWN
jgi:hypothetical protein